MQSCSVSTRCGGLRGARLESRLGDVYCAFKGIPFAEPPVGELRFRDPRPVKPWAGERDATKYGPQCPQWDNTSNSVKGSEDCLYLNVYTRNLKPDKPLPVMVFIHGGSFLQGSGDDWHFGPDYLMTKPIVLVTINYRLGMIGFLNLDDEVAPGNQGLKDQVLALKWVRDNIANFGGDPGNVTIFGASAGAGSVHCLCLSPLAEGLFHKAICQSSVVLCGWAENEGPRKIAEEVLENLKHEERDPKAAAEFLRAVDADKLVEVQTKMFHTNRILRGSLPFVPSCDDKSPEPFMPVPTREAAKKGIQVPLIMGWNSLEGLFTEHIIKPVGFETINDKFEEYNPTKNLAKKYNLTAEDIRKIYFGDEDITEENSTKFYELWSDCVFVDGIHEVAKIQSQIGNAPTYFYRFSYDKTASWMKRLLNVTKKGACHGDELNFLFSAKLCDALNVQQLEGTGAERLMLRLVEMWTNFARTGTPTPSTSELVPLKWEPLDDGSKFRVLNIDDELRMEIIPNIEHRFKNTT